MLQIFEVLIIIMLLVGIKKRGILCFLLICMLFDYSRGIHIDVLYSRIIQLSREMKETYDFISGVEITERWLVIDYDTWKLKEAKDYQVQVIEDVMYWLCEKDNYEWSKSHFKEDAFIIQMDDDMYVPDGFVYNVTKVNNKIILEGDHVMSCIIGGQ